MFELNFSYLTVRFEYSFGLSDVLEGIHWPAVPELWDGFGREEMHLLTVFLINQASIVMHRNCDSLLSCDFLAWMYEISWTCRVIIIRQLKWPTEAGLDYQVKCFFFTTQLFRDVHTYPQIRRCNCSSLECNALPKGILRKVYSGIGPIVHCGVACS